MATKRNKFRDELLLIMKVLAVDSDIEVDYFEAFIDFERRIDDVAPAVKAGILTSSEGQLVKSVMGEYYNVAKLHFINDVLDNELYANDDIWKDMREAAKAAAAAMAE
ncbi:hypothetical protein [Aeoliella sp.]|uniref:hypothetical protein n=1 Tax=Aeoliella sp. TaxID=2795800 RepID=UPI003CCBAD7D